MSCGYSNCPSEIRPTWKPGSGSACRYAPFHVKLIPCGNFRIFHGITTSSVQIPNGRRSRRRRGITLDDLNKVQCIHKSWKESICQIFFEKFQLTSTCSDNIFSRKQLSCNLHLSTLSNSTGVGDRIFTVCKVSHLYWSQLAPSLLNQNPSYSGGVNNLACNLHLQSASVDAR